MTLNSKRTLKSSALKYLGGTALAAGAVSALIAAGTNAAEPSSNTAVSRADRANQALSTVLARGAELTGDQEAALQKSPGIRSINADLTGARSITPPAGAEKAAWFVVPAKDGSGRACLDVGNGVVCGEPEQVASTGIAVFRVERPVGGKDSPFAPGGRAYLSGIVPSGVSSIVALNTAGSVVKQVSVAGQAYQLDLATEDLGSIEYRGSDGLATATTPIIR
jgi:hypothetical protein